MRYILYFLITVAATSIGALTGMGGGVIIKPILDALGGLDTASVNLLSSITVFVMAIMSVIKQVRQKTEVNLKMVVYLATGALFGGNIGQKILIRFLSIFNSSRQVVSLQNICLAFMIITVFLFMKKRKHHRAIRIHMIYIAIITGVLLGAVSSFLGIGGGPINVALIVIVFACDIKTATVYSIVTILFAQASKILSVFMSGALLSHDLSMLPVMAMGAVIGGWFGSHLNHTLPDETVEKAFKSALVFVLLICIFNVFKSLL